MPTVEILADSTKLTGELYLLIDEESYLLPFEQDKANKGQILGYPEFEDEEDVNITPPFPKVFENSDVFIFWYTFYYLMAGKIAPPNVEKQYLSLIS